MRIIEFENPSTWLELVEKSLQNPQEYFERLSQGDIEYSHWDCSGLDHIIDDAELGIILDTIADNLNGYSLRLYHGCRLHGAEDPRISGLKISSTQGIEQALVEMAQKDAVLKNHLHRIKIEIEDKFTREQAEGRNGQIWFCIRYKEMVEEGGVYCAFGSEYRLMILNSISPNLKARLLYYGTPAIVVLKVPIEPYLVGFRDYAAKYLFSLWIHYRLGIDDINFPSGFACYLQEDIPAEYITDIIKPEKVYDQYNENERWYTWAEMVLEEQRL
jgi:hypothetical protein